MKRLSTIIIVSLLFLTSCSFAEMKDDKVAGEEGTNQQNEQEIEHALTKIIGSPSATSNPNDYVKAHPEEFAYIVGQGELALGYFLSEFKKTSTDGLREYVMALACTEILGSLNPIDNWETGRAWYNSYKQ
ncbi:hypothetical protein [Gracilibacillus massiliensis]|uniref:hypothetical protein n=1 Tax=Gracilibacillus massiliensis TaxID=1564956 RepID=UPI00071D7171|nr:hypothetical protein [Gracilibacillus massiliensis]